MVIGIVYTLQLDMNGIIIEQKMTPHSLWLVRADGLKRAFNFRKGSKIQIGMMMMVMFTHKDIVEEIAVDEDERAGRETRSKLKFD